jgi:hypothetical protein
MKLKSVTNHNNDLLGQLTSEQIRYLLDNYDLIYLCDDCDEYHIQPTRQWIDVELALKGFPG